MLDSMLMTAFMSEISKLADDPDAALLPKVKGLKSIRNNGPRLRMGTKGQVPVNPYSGNWVKQPKNILQKAAGAPTPEQVHHAGEEHERMGKKMRNVGYGSAAALLAGSFIPAVRNRNWARRLARGGAAVAGAGGYLGEGGIRSGKGYQRAADVASGKAKAPKDEEYMSISPSAYREASQALQKSASLASLREIAGTEAAGLRLNTPARKRLAREFRQKSDVVHEGTQQFLGGLRKGYHKDLRKYVEERGEKSADLNPLHAALGIGAAVGTGALAHKTYKAVKDPYSRPAKDSRGAAALVHGARGGQFFAGAHPEQLLAALR